MDRRIETRVIDTGGVAGSALIQKDACEVWWLAISPETPTIAGVLKLYDGFDATGKLELQIEKAAAQIDNFIPPIPCDHGIFVTWDAKIASFTIAYRGKGWPREQK